MKRLYMATIAAITCAFALLSHAPIGTLGFAAADTTLKPGVTVNRSDESFYKAYQMTDGTVQSFDTIPAGRSIYYGPYPIAPGTRQQGAAYTYVSFWAANGAIGAGDSLNTAIQFVSDTNSTDTVSTSGDWLVIEDKWHSTGGWGDTTYRVDDKGAAALMVRIRNYNGADTIIVAKKSKIIFEVAR